MIPTDDVDCDATTENNEFATINPLLLQFKDKIDATTARFQREYNFEKNDLSKFSMHKYELKNVLIQTIVEAKDEGMDNLYNALKNYLLNYPDLFWDEKDEATGIVPYAKQQLRDYITRKVDLIYIPRPTEL